MKSPMPSIRMMLIAVYTILTMTGVGMIVWKPLMISHELGPALTVGLGTVTAASGLACTIAAARWLWRIEWVSLYMLDASVTGYALVAVASSLQGRPGLLVEASLFASVAGLLIIRILGLAALNAQTLGALRHRVQMEVVTDAEQ